MTSPRHAVQRITRSKNGNDKDFLDCHIENHKIIGNQSSEECMVDSSQETPWDVKM
jgi:hypothetical protein